MFSFLVKKGKTIKKRTSNSHTEIPTIAFVLAGIPIIGGAALLLLNDWLRDVWEFAFRHFNNWIGTQ